MNSHKKYKNKLVPTNILKEMQREIKIRQFKPVRDKTYSPLRNDNL